MDVLAIPAVGLVAKRVEGNKDDRKLPLLGVMGAFVFAAQMINFPVGLGTSGHLVGGTLLAIVLGPAAAAIVMTGILAIQAFVFQDGGILALGANVFNMAFAGVLAGYLPYRLWPRSAGIFMGGLFSVLMSASLALAELLISGVAMPRKILFVSLALFLVSAALEGAITLSAVRAIERIAPVRAPESSASSAIAWIAIAAIVLVMGGVVIASTAPDGIQKLLSEYQPADAPWLRRAVAGLGGLAAIYAVCTLAGRLLRPRSS